MPEVTPNEAFQTMEEVKEYLSGRTITCLICGKEMQRLRAHLDSMHDMSVDDYRVRFGIPHTRPLATLESRAKSSAIGKAPKNMERFMRVRTIPQKGNPHSPRPLVPAMIKHLREVNAEGLASGRRLVVVACAKCGGDYSTSASHASRPVVCMRCASPRQFRTRLRYFRLKRAPQPDLKQAA